MNFDGSDQRITSSYWPADESDEVRDHTIGRVLSLAASRWARRTALVDGCPQLDGRRWTFEDLEKEAKRVGHALLARFSPGDRLAIWAANCPEWVLLELGAALAGLTLVTVNPAYRPAELEYVLRQSKARGIVVQREHRSRDLLHTAATVSKALPWRCEVISLGDWHSFVRTGTEDGPLPYVRPGDTAQIQYTSGTTGFPKGALLTHRGLANNGRLYARAIGAEPDDVWVNPMPLFHTAGCGLVTLGALQTGGTHVLPAGFDAGVMLDLFAAERGTLLLSVPTMLIRMLDEQASVPRDLSSWRVTTLGGAPVPPELVHRAERELGVQVAIGFGQTETSPYITHTRPADPHPRWWETVGRPLPQVEVKIVDPVDGDTQPLDQIGEVCTRSVCVMQGYNDDPDATAAAIDAEGWLHTGDLGSLDSHGYLRIQGRLKEMIIRGGENIYPREIEDVLFTHPDLSGACVVGLPDDTWGEIVAAFVSLRPNASTDAPALTRFCREQLASFKVPQVWEFVADFPQTASGKIQKFILKERLLHRDGEV
ncbi:AMP-binding protein [Streptomyces sp. NPDC088387]|uniref:AMP-binding protein n=1 Tax=Streptomyces sp. NPDC088387 TaxID=3365859 RepID=UPI003816230F